MSECESRHHGGGMHLVRGAAVTLVSSRVESCRAGSNGGAAAVSGAHSKLQLVNVSLSLNAAAITASALWIEKQASLGTGGLVLNISCSAATPAIDADGSATVLIRALVDVSGDVCQPGAEDVFTDASWFGDCGSNTCHTPYGKGKQQPQCSVHSIGGLPNKTTPFCACGEAANFVHLSRAAISDAIEGAVLDAKTAYDTNDAYLYGCEAPSVEPAFSADGYEKYVYVWAEKPDVQRRELELDFRKIGSVFQDHAGSGLWFWSINVSGQDAASFRANQSAGSVAQRWPRLGSAQGVVVAFIEMNSTALQDREAPYTAQVKLNIWDEIGHVNISRGIEVRPASLRAGTFPELAVETSLEVFSARRSFPHALETFSTRASSDFNPLFKPVSPLLQRYFTRAPNVSNPFQPRFKDFQRRSKRFRCASKSFNPRFKSFQPALKRFPPEHQTLSFTSHSHRHLH
eukprot:6181018-Pleurochrysis_carterae.AAC.1